MFHETVDFLILLASVGAIKGGTAVLRQPIAMAFQSGGAAFVVAGWPIARGALVTEAGQTSPLLQTPRSVFPGSASLPTRATTMR